MKKSFLLVAIVFSIIFVGCGKVSPNFEKAESFLRLAFTVPNSPINDVVTSSKATTDIEKYDSMINAAISSFCDGFVSEKIMLDTTSTFYNEIVMLHITASAKNFTYTLQDVVVNELNENQYDYTASVLASDIVDAFTITGSVQFDSAGEIDYMTARTH